MSLLALLAALAWAEPPAGLPYEPEKAFPRLSFEDPLFLAAPPDGTDRVFVVLQEGKLLWFRNDPQAQRVHTALELGPKVRRRHNEEGLLGLAFHPRFKENGRLFLYYSASGPRRTVVSAWRMDEGRRRVLPESEEVLLELPQPYGNHNGGMLAFGPDGFLYVGPGDGGSGGDPHDHGQRLDVLLGKILRIDVDRRDEGRAYAIPPDNPFIGREGARAEIWATGLRNPWRFSFDREGGALWAGDVGQDEWEEIDLVVRGGNYGWNAREGARPYEPKGREGPFVEPVAVHGRDEAQSITGGYVYRGRRLPELRGAYVYGDFMTGRIWALRSAGGGPPEPLAQGSLISSFGEDEAGELYWTSFDGSVYRLRRRPRE